MRGTVTSLGDITAEGLFSPVPTPMEAKGREPTLHFFEIHGLAPIHGNGHRVAWDHA